MGNTQRLRIDIDLLNQVEQVRDAARFPTQSDFVREALKRMIREEEQRREAAAIDQRSVEPGPEARTVGEKVR